MSALRSALIMLASMIGQKGIAAVRPAYLGSVANNAAWAAVQSAVIAWAMQQVLHFDGMQVGTCQASTVGLRYGILYATGLAGHAQIVLTAGSSCAHLAMMAGLGAMRLLLSGLEAGLQL
jgi:hypothetical protein